MSKNRYFKRIYNKKLLWITFMILKSLKRIREINDENKINEFEDKCYYDEQLNYLF